LSPDLDGINDLLTISWRFPETGNIMSMRILDSRGRVILTLMRNRLAGTTGVISWNGLSEGQQKLAAGPYVLWTEVADRHGKLRVRQYPFLIAYR
jgi:hypothetical protein